MDIFRAVCGVSLFIASTYLVVDGVLASPSDWVLFGIGAAGFVLAYLLWPSKRRGQRHQDNPFWDILEILVELPVELLLWFGRLLGRLLSGKGGGVDLDF